MVLNRGWTDIKVIPVPFKFILSYISYLHIMNINTLLIISLADVLSIYLYVSSVYLLVYLQWNTSCSDAQLCLTLCDPMDCSLPGSPVHGTFQERILE